MLEYYELKGMMINYGLGDGLEVENYFMMIFDILSFQIFLEIS